MLYKKPQLLILDEATSAMDKGTESIILNILKQTGITIFFISHRLHTLKEFAKTIYILEKGVITHKGNHNTLLRTNNFYSQYFDI